MKLRPHHVLDIISSYGNGEEFKPHPYGHALHSVAQAILSDLKLEIEFVVGADEICAPCVHLREGRCDDVLSQLEVPISKQDYNDGLDSRLCEYFGFAPGARMTMREYLEIINGKLSGLERICSHPKEDVAGRRNSLEKGLKLLLKS